MHLSQTSHHVHLELCQQLPEIKFKLDAISCTAYSELATASKIIWGKQPEISMKRSIQL